MSLLGTVHGFAIEKARLAIRDFKMHHWLVIGLTLHILVDLTLVPTAGTLYLGHGARHILRILRFLKSRHLVNGLEFGSEAGQLLDATV